MPYKRHISSDLHTSIIASCHSPAIKLVATNIMAIVPADLPLSSPPGEGYSVRLATPDDAEDIYRFLCSAYQTEGRFTRHVATKLGIPRKTAKFFILDFIRQDEGCMSYTTCHVGCTRENKVIGFINVFDPVKLHTIGKGIVPPGFEIDDKWMREYMAMHPEGYVFIHTLAVDEEHRKLSKLGSILMTSVVKWFDSDACKYKKIACTALKKTRANILYKRLGFEILWKANENTDEEDWFIHRQKNKLPFKKLDTQPKIKKPQMANKP